MSKKVKTINSSIESIQFCVKKIVIITQGVSENTIRWKPSEEEWSIIQILSHLSEAIPYWLNEIQKLVANPGIEWGRGLQDPSRLKAVATPDDLSVEQVIVEVDSLIENVALVLSGLDEEKLAQESPHRNFTKFGYKPVQYIVDHFIEEHLNEHYQQIQRNLSKLEI